MNAVSDRCYYHFSHVLSFSAGCDRGRTHSITTGSTYQVFILIRRRMQITQLKGNFVFLPPIRCQIYTTPDISHHRSSWMSFAGDGDGNGSPIATTSVRPEFGWEPLDLAIMIHLASSPSSSIKQIPQSDFRPL